MKKSYFLLFGLIFIAACGTQTKTECDTSCLDNYIPCLVEVETCKVNCESDFNKYVDDNRGMCREFDGTTRCQDTSEPVQRQNLAREMQTCKRECDNNIDKCEICITDIKQCITEQNEG